LQPASQIDDLFVPIKIVYTTTRISWLATLTEDIVIKPLIKSEADTFGEFGKCGLELRTR
jgi:hypothetical protein